MFGSYNIFETASGADNTHTVLSWQFDLALYKTVAVQVFGTVNS